MDKKIFRKMPRREANYLSLQEWIKPKKIPRKFELGVSALLQLYRQGNIHNPVSYTHLTLPTKA